MRKSFALFIGVLLLSLSFQSDKTTIKSIHDYKVVDLYGKEFDFSTLKGKKVMVVNTASKCGLTPQYKQLEELYQTYKSKGFVVIGFPSNDFMKQEPGTNEEIAAFCAKNYGVSFPMMDKVLVKGKKKCAVYQFLTSKKLNGLEDNSVKWNFQKYLLNEKGELEKVIAPSVLPNSPEIIQWIEKK